MIGRQCVCACGRMCVTVISSLSQSLSLDCKELEERSDRMERGDGGEKQRDGGMESQTAE